MTRLTQAQVQDLVKAELFYYHGTLTVCVMDLTNGAQVVGTSNVIDPDNYDQAIGEDVAKADAIAQIWKMEGYALKTRPPVPEPVANPWPEPETELELGPEPENI